MTAAAILAPLGPRLTPDEAAFFRAADPWGFILFARNVETPAQVQALTGELRAAVGRDAPVLVDQEGGRVQRLRAPYWREWIPPLDQASGPDAERALWLRYALIAAELRAVGIDTDCAPCADIAGPATHPFLRNRCLGEDAATVARNARAVADGLLAGGVLPLMKHMPGHGRAEVDSHLLPPGVTTDADTLAATDFAVFQDLSDLPLGMTAHVVYGGIDPRPATLSPAMIRVIRDQIGFRGLLISDDLSMEALSGTLAGRAAGAIAAGCDIALYCKGLLPESEAVVEAAGLLSATARAAGEAALALRGSPALDIAALEAEFAALTGRGQG
jgi:beta-N-acetylhexosaminidase